MSNAFLVAIAGAAAGAVFAGVRVLAGWWLARIESRGDTVNKHVHELETIRTQLERWAGDADPKVLQYRVGEAEDDLNGLGAKLSTSVRDLEARLRAESGRQELRHREEMRVLREACQAEHERKAE